MTYDDIITATRQAVARRNQARDAYGETLRARIEDLLDVCAVMRVELGGYVVADVEVEADCSQWANRIDYPHREGRALLITQGPAAMHARSLGEAPDLGFFDGHNNQPQHGAARYQDTAIRPATVEMLVAIGRAFPEVAAVMLAARKTEMKRQVAAVEDAK